MKKKEITKRIVAGTLSLVALSSVKAFDAQSKRNVEAKDAFAKTAQSDGLVDLCGKKNDGVAVLSVGNHKKVGTSFQDAKLKILQSMEVDTALIINCDTVELHDIYNDVEYVKSVLSKYDINLPVYMDVNKIMENTSINNNDKKELISSFLEKCEVNRIYVGVYGTDTNLCRLKKYVYPEIINYDAFVEIDKENDEIEYDGTYNMYKKDGCFILKSDLSKCIIEKELNEEKNFVNDATYTYEDEEKLQEYLFISGLSKEELKKYNGQFILNKGDELKVPTIIQAETNSSEYGKSDELLIGCDISSNQIDEGWDELAQNMDFIIIKAATGYEKESKFEDFYRKSIEHNLPVGIYTIVNFTKIGCPNMEDFKIKQAKTSTETLRFLDNKKIDLPVYLDIENPYSKEEYSPSQLFDKEHIQFMLEDWYEKMSSAGYIPGIYANKNYLDYISKCVDPELFSKFQIWIAGGNEYKTEKKYDEYEFPEYLRGYKGSTVYQVSDHAIGAGMGNEDGYIDIDYSEIDFGLPQFKDGDSASEKEIKEFNRVDGVVLGSGVLGIVGAGVGTGFYLKNKKRKRKNCK